MRLHEQAPVRALPRPGAPVDQALDRDYPQVLRDLGVPILLVAVTYDAETREHACSIVEA